MRKLKTVYKPWRRIAVFNIVVREGLIIWVRTLERLSELCGSLEMSCLCKINDICKSSEKVYYWTYF